MKENLLQDKKIPLKTLFSRTKKYIKKEVKSFIFSLILVILNVTCSVILPRVTGFYTDYISGASPELKIIIVLAISTLLLSVVSQLFLFLENMILVRAGQRIVYELRMETFSHIESMSQNQFNNMAVGSLVTRVCSYTSQLSEFFTNVLVTVIRDLLTIVIVYVWMVALSWQLGLILSAVCALVFIISFIFSKKVHKLFSDERNQMSDLNTYLNECLSGMRIIQIFNQEKRYEKAFCKKSNEYFKTSYNITIAFAIYRPLVSLIYVLSIALIIFMGLKLSLSAGMIVSFYLFVDYFFEPIQKLADELNHITRAATSIERLYNLLDITPEVLDDEDAIELENFKGKIEFKNVYFAYEDENWVLKDVSFVVNPGETAAFVGATGSGKTTILGLIVRNFEVQKGQILIDDIDIKKIKLSSLRKAVGQMLQEVFLFSGTIKENITLFDSDYSQEEIDAAVKYVNADSFINTLPEQLETKVVEKGGNFSTGQRQLLSFARTVLHRPQIMILDEATANIDTETEHIIQDSLEKMKNIGTMLIVAHRLSTIQHSDKIIVLSNGEIIETGTHQSLIKKGGYYYNLYKLQFED